MIFNAEDAFVHPSELERSEVYVPEPIADFFEADVFAGQRVRDADPALLPADPTVAAHEADLKVTGVFEGRELPRQFTPRRSIVRGGRLLGQGFAWALVVVVVPKPVEAYLLRLEIGARWARGLGLEGPRHALVAPVLLG